MLGVILGLILGSLLVLARTYCKRARLAFWGGSRRPISSFSATRPICSGSLCAWCSVPARHSLPRQRPHKTEVLLYLPFPSYSKPFAQKARARAAETAAGCGLSAPFRGLFCVREAAFSENAAKLQKKLQFSHQKRRFPIDSLVIIGV